MWFLDVVPLPFGDALLSVSFAGRVHSCLCLIQCSTSSARFVVILVFFVFVLVVMFCTFIKDTLHRLSGAEGSCQTFRRPFSLSIFLTPLRVLFGSVLLLATHLVKSNVLDVVCLLLCSWVFFDVVDLPIPRQVSIR